MRLTRDAWEQLRPLFRTGTALEFDYNSRHRFGRLDTVGEGPNGAFLTLKFPDGSYKNFSLSKVENLTVRGWI
jgi:hypothetical protein